ncbi:MAG: Rrf2 family transcriptional regulator [candidate division WOR-3 bacterium]
MKITRELECTIAILTALGRNEGKYLSLNDIVSIINFPKPFTRKIMAKILKLGYVKSEMGPQGGYALNIDAKKISLKKLIADIENRKKFVECYNSTICLEKHKCVISGSMNKLNKELDKVFESFTLENFIKGE